MQVYPALGDALSKLNILIIQSNTVVAGAIQKRLPEDEDGKVKAETGWWVGKKKNIDGHFYVALLHGPEKHYRYIVTGNEPFATQSSAETAAELLLKYANQMEPMPADWYPPEEQLVLFSDEQAPVARAA